MNDRPEGAARDLLINDFKAALWKMVREERVSGRLPPKDIGIAIEAVLWAVRQRYPDWDGAE